MEILGFCRGLCDLGAFKALSVFFFFLGGGGILGFLSGAFGIWGVFKGLLGGLRLLELEWFSGFRGLGV